MQEAFEEYDGKLFEEGWDWEKFCDQFAKNNRHLDHINEELSQYLEYKRSDFARLYFISDKALIDILANSKDPLLIQKDIGTCFEGIKVLKFTKKQEI